jgi:protein-tyrosine phosphatase
MRAIIPHLLWIGNAIEARDVSSVLNCGIRAVVDVAIEEKPALFPRDIVYCRVPLNDGHGNAPKLLRFTIKVIVELVSAGQQTLICCGAGMSRSPTIAAHVLSQLRGVSAQLALSEITRNGPHDVSPLFWDDVSKSVADPSHR